MAARAPSVRSPKSPRLRAKAQAAAPTFEQPELSTPRKVQKSPAQPISKQAANVGEVNVDISVLGRTFWLCMTAIPVCYALSAIDRMATDHMLVFVAGVVICVGMGFVSYYAIFKHVKHSRHDPYLYIFTVFAFTTIVDIQLALNIEGHASNVMFYLKEGEQYLLSAHGALINWWDGTVHFVLYLVMICELAKGKLAVDASLLWFGSIFNSLLVFMPGNAVGPWGIEIRAAYLLNIPFCLVPVYYLLRVLKRPNNKLARATAAHASADGTAFVVKTALVSLVLFSSSFILLRTLAALGSPISFAKGWLSYEPFILDPNAYPKLQVLVYAFYFLPYFCWALWGLLDAQVVSPALVDTSVIFAGAVAQGQFSMFLTGVHPLTKASLHVPQSSLLLITALNVVFTATALLLAWRFRSYRSK